jgi:hypothetical protein
MEPVGSHYAVILHNPELRRAVVNHAEQRSSAHPTKAAAIDMRFKVAQALRSLASHIDPGQSALDLASRREPVSLQ